MYYFSCSVSPVTCQTKPTQSTGDRVIKAVESKIERDIVFYKFSSGEVKKTLGSFEPAVNIRSYGNTYLCRVNLIIVIGSELLLDPHSCEFS